MLIQCPYCKITQFIEFEEIDYEEDGLNEKFCEDCNKVFYTQINTTYIYSVSKTKEYNKCYEVKN